MEWSLSTGLESFLTFLWEFDMRILELTPNYVPSKGGVETHMHEINKRLVKDGFEIEVITQKEPNAPESEVKDAVSIHRIPVFEPLKLKYSLGRVMPHMLFKMHRANFDIVHAHAYGYFPTWASMFSNKPTVITTHSDPAAKIYPFSDLLRSIPIRKCDLVVATTDMEKHHLIQRGVKQKKITVIPNGVTLPPMDAPTRNLGKIILCLARLDAAHKGQDTLLQAMPKVLSKIPDVKLWVAGEGKDSEMLKKLTKKLKIGVNVEFKGPINECFKSFCLKNCRLLCVSPRTESFGIVYLEAMAYGLPVVTTRAGGVPEVVGDAALLVPPNDPAALADALIKVLTDKRCADDLSKKGLERVKLFDWDSIAKKYEEIYEKISIRGY